MLIIINDSICFENTLIHNCEGAKYTKMYDVLSFTFSGCTQFGHIVSLVPIEIIGQNLPPFLYYHFIADGICSWKKTSYSADGESWLSTEDNLGTIGIDAFFNKKTLLVYIHHY